MCLTVNLHTEDGEKQVVYKVVTECPYNNSCVDGSKDNILKSMRYLKKVCSLPKSVHIVSGDRDHMELLVCGEEQDPNISENFKLFNLKWEDLPLIDSSSSAELIKLIKNCKQEDIRQI